MGTFDVELIVQWPCALPDTIVETVIINTSPIIDAGLDQIVCDDGTMITLFGVGATSYVWDNGISNNVSFLPLLGITTYTVTGTDINGCESTDQVDVIVNTLPIIDAGSDQALCNDGTQIVLSGSGALNYIWNNGVIDNIAFIPLLGTTTYIVTGTDVNGCTNLDQIEVTVNSLPIVNAGADQVYCDDVMTIVLSASGALNYAWNNGILDNISFTSSFGTTTYNVIGTDVNGCFNTDNVDVAIIPSPMVNFTSDVTSGCAPLSITLTNLSGLNSIDCQWVFSDGTILSGCNTISTVFENPDLYDVSLTVTSNTGCSSSITFTDYILVEENPIANFSFFPKNPTTDDDQIIFTDQSVGSTTFNWIFNNIETSTVQNPIFNFIANGNSSYEICQYVSSDFGCVDSICQIIMIQEDIIFYVPNAFTPDGDAYNQMFKPVINSGIDPYDYHLILFNRWGEILFESYDFNYGWDGTYKGQLVPTGIYTWRIDFGDKNNDKRYNYNGHVNVLK